MSEKLFPRSPRVDLEDYDFLLANLTILLINADLQNGTIHRSDEITAAQIEARIVKASEILYSVKNRSEEFR